MKLLARNGTPRSTRKITYFQHHLQNKRQVSFEKLPALLIVISGVLSNSNFATTSDSAQQAQAGKHHGVGLGLRHCGQYHVIQVAVITS